MADLAKSIKLDHGQLPPDVFWSNWVLLGGRGAGKTTAAGIYVHDELARSVVKPIQVLLVGPTLGHAQQIMLPWARDAGRNHVKVSCPRYIGEIHGSQYDLVWVDEPLSCYHRQAVFEHCQMAARDGRMVVSQQQQRETYPAWFVHFMLFGATVVARPRPGR